MSTKPTDVLPTLEKQQASVEEIAELLHNYLREILQRSRDPRHRISVAELVNSYANIHRTLLDISKTISDLPAKEIELERKKKEVEHDEDLDVLKLQRLLMIAHQKGAVRLSLLEQQIRDSQSEEVADGQGQREDSKETSVIDVKE